MSLLYQADYFISGRGGNGKAIGCSEKTSDNENLTGTLS